VRAEAHTDHVAGSAGLVRGQVNRFGSARPEVLVVSSTRPAASYGATSTLRLVLIELDARIHIDARPLATSIRCGIDTAVQCHIAWGTSVTGHCAIAAPRSITSPARHPSIGPEHLRPDDPARQPRRLTDRQLTPAA
jgi:hypothetical protein